MARQGLVELSRDAVQLVQTRPWDGGEIVVLVVQADVVGEEIERAVVRVCLRGREGVQRVVCLLLRLLGVVLFGDGLGAVVDAREEVVFCDEVAGAGVQGAGEEGAQEEVEERLEGVAAQARKGVVEGELDEEVEGVDGGEGRAVDEHGAQGVEEDLEGAEEGLAEEGVEEEGFDGGGEVGVEAGDAEGFVVREVVGLAVSVSLSVLNMGKGFEAYPEGGTIGQPDGEIGEDGQETVGQGRAKGEVMGDLVDGQEDILVGGGSDHVGRGDEAPVQHGGVSQEVCAAYLQGDDTEYHILGQGFRAAKLGDLDSGDVSTCGTGCREKMAVTSGWALMIACRLDRCGSSVYVQKNWSSTAETSAGGILVDGVCSWDFAADTRRCGRPVVSTAEDMTGT